MSEMTVGAPGPPAATAGKGFAARVVGVFVAPGDTFEDVRRKPTILLPMIALYVLMAVIFYVIFPAQAADQQTRAEGSARFQALSQEQQEQQLGFATGPIARKIGSAAGPAAILIIGLLFALVYWGGAHLLGGEPTYKAMLSMFLFVSMINPVMHSIVKAPLMLAKDTVIGITFGPGMFLPGLEVTSMTYQALALFDVFNIWSVAVTGIGIAKISRISTAAGMGIAIVVFAIGAAIQLGLTRLFT